MAKVIKISKSGTANGYTKNFSHTERNYIQYGLKKKQASNNSIEKKSHDLRRPFIRVANYLPNVKNLTLIIIIPGHPMSIYQSIRTSLTRTSSSWCPKIIHQICYNLSIVYNSTSIHQTFRLSSNRLQPEGHHSNLRVIKFKLRDGPYRSTPSVASTNNGQHFQSK